LPSTSTGRKTVVAAHCCPICVRYPSQPADYQSRERLQLKFRTYLKQAAEAGMLSERTVVVLPEHVGTGLFALGEKPEVQQARTLRDAMQWMALSNPGSYLRALPDNQGNDRRTGAVLRLKARQMAEEYQNVFGGLAREFGVTLVAGSIVLPEPYLENDQLMIGDGPLRQVSLTFDGRGKPLGTLQYKQALSRYERRYSVAPIPERRRLIETPAGSLAVLLGCDAYLEQPPAEAKLLAVPGALADPQASCGIPTRSAQDRTWPCIPSPCPGIYSARRAARRPRATASRSRYAINGSAAPHEFATGAPGRSVGRFSAQPQRCVAAVRP